LGADNDWIAGDIEFSEGATQFRVVRAEVPGKGSFGGRQVREHARVRLPLLGRHNVLNALAAMAIADSRGIPADEVVRALASFRGVARRMTLRGEVAGVTVVDDFAHHPTAIAATIEGARSRWPGQRLWVAFEPRSNTMRRRIFEDPLADALGTADGVVLGPVNRSQLLSDSERLSPERVVARIAATGRTAKLFNSSAEIADFLAAESRKGDVVLVLSNGSFDGLCDKLLAALAPRSSAPREVSGKVLS
jgi:UDP-N-acetylmuramate: L-alanyl-gamma-D-glutamyl-meso-diaminopimelate ligase